MEDPEIHTGHRAFMREALLEAEAAYNAGEFPVGCVIVLDNRIVATGGRRNSTIEISELDHAEVVALRNLQNTHPDVDLSRAILYTTMEPCLMCFATLLVNNITHIVFGYEDVMGGGTNLPLDKLSPLYAQMQVTVKAGVLRSECLELFQRFFADEKNIYLKGTLLATHTLNQ